MLENVLNLPLGYLLSVSRSASSDCVVWQTLWMFSLPVNWLTWFGFDIAQIFASTLINGSFSPILLNYCDDKKKQRDFEMAFRWKCDELRRYWCFCCCRCSVVRIGDFSYQNNQYSIFISFSITLFMWCMWRMRANRNKIVCIKWRKFGMDEWGTLHVLIVCIQPS